MTRKLSSNLKTFGEAYLEHYRGVRDVLERRLPELGEGKDGFRPPFFYGLTDGIVIRRRRKEGFRAGRIGRITRILRVARSTRGRNLSLSDHPACPGTLATVPGGS